jgi:hypothetical protein
MDPRTGVAVDRDDRDRDADARERAEPDQPPVDGPGTGSGGQPGDDDLADTSLDEPGRSERD